MILRMIPALVAALQQGPVVPAVSRAPQSSTRAVETVVVNDNRVPAGSLRGGVLRLRLAARLATWRPDSAVDSTASVMAFAEEGGAVDAPRIPGPLLRVEEGTEVRMSVRNSIPDSTLVVHGLRAGTVVDDTVQIAPGAVREVTFRARTPGTYLYWGTVTKAPIATRMWRDSQLTGAIVVDPRGTRPDSAERILVITVLDLPPGDTIYNKKKEDIWELAINGRSWPHNERLQYAVGDTVRWRWINGSYLPHPMHLHGFHFRVLSKGEENSDTTYAAAGERHVVTEFMAPGSTFRMAWVPTRAGNWLMHCHMRPHVTPFPERPDSLRAHDVHDVSRHPVDAMAGLVLGVTSVERGGVASAPPPSIPARRLRVFVQQARADSGKPAPRGYVLQRAEAPRPDSVEVPGTPLVLTRGETIGITVVNRLPEPTTVHWHGMELESVYDGVSGWSRTGGSVAPLVAPSDSFAVTFTPPRAGTFMYHTHMDENSELARGLYGPLIVLEPGERWDPSRDLVFMIGSAVERDTIRLTINGRQRPAPIEVRAGTPYRLRFANIHSAAAAVVELAADSAVLRWRPLSKDGADLPSPRRAQVPAQRRRFGTGETFDVEWVPHGPMEAVLTVRVEGTLLRQVFRVTRE